MELRGRGGGGGGRGPGAGGWGWGPGAGGGGGVHKQVKGQNKLFIGKAGKKCPPGVLHGQPDFILRLKGASVPEGKPSFFPHIRSCWETLIGQPARNASLFYLLCF